MTIVSLLRHGEVEGGECLRGRTNDPLTTQGLEQMRTATKPPYSCDLVISSPLQRCTHFAKEFAARHELPLRMDSRLAEIDFGDWDGRTTKDIYDKTPQALTQFWSDPDKYPPPNGERLSTFQTRVLRAWRDIVKNHAGQHTLVVTHSGVMRVLTCHLQDIPLAKIMELEVGYGALFSFANDQTANKTNKEKFELREQT